MSSPVVLAIDQGTTNTTVLAVDAQGQVAARHRERVGIAFPRPGWVESDPHDLDRTVRAAVAAVVDQLDGAPVTGIGVTNQRETIVAWDPVTGDALGPAISWQCTRGVDWCRRVSTPAADALVRAKTGLHLDPMFSASKMRWVLDHLPDARARAADGHLVIGTVDSWLLWNLTGGDVLGTDLTNASRTALCDISTGTWSDTLLDLFGVPAAALVPIRPSAYPFGECRIPELAGNPVPVGSMIGDSHAALVGHGAYAPGAVKASFGTGTSVMGIIEDPDTRVPGLSTTIGWSAAGEPSPQVLHALEGNIYATGAALEWTADLLGVDVESLEDLARSADASAEVALVPAFSGLGAPHWDPTARGTILGLTRGAGRAELARATFDAVAHQVADVVEVIGPALAAVEARLFTDGGAMRSGLLAATVADLTGMTLLVSHHGDEAALGAAHLAGLTVGVWSSIEELAALPRSTTEVPAELPATDRRTRRQRWAAAVPRSRGWQGG